MTNEEAIGKIVNIMLKKLPPRFVADLTPQIFDVIKKIGVQDHDVSSKTSSSDIIS